MKSDLTRAREAARAEANNAGMVRRDFLAILGTSFAALSVSGCNFRAPKEKIIPYIQQPEDAASGVANWYASTCGGCSAKCGVLTKVRDGRPIKLEGNPEHPMSRGGLCARGQATVLDLYDSQRLRGPLARGAWADWTQVDTDITSSLRAIRARGGSIRILSSTVTSPTLLRAIRAFKESYPTTKHVVVDALDASAILQAHESTHGKPLLPHYRFDKADVIVAIEADFLGTWLSPVEFTRQWAERRGVSEEHPGMVRHIQLEAGMTTTGANADLRIPVAPSLLSGAALYLARAVGERLGLKDAAKIPDVPQLTELDAVADELVKAKGKSLVVSGSNDVNVQLAVNAMNAWLGNYGETLDIAQPSLQYQGRNADVDTLIKEMNAGWVDALIVLDANPAHASSNAAGFAKAMKNVALTVSLSGRNDETARLADYVCPDHHPLESWGDAHPRMGLYSMYQPTIRPLYKTRATVETLMGWIGTPTSAYDLMQAAWKKEVFKLMADYGSFTPTWNQTVQNGVLVIDTENVEVSAFNGAALSLIAYETTSLPEAEFEVLTYAGVALGDGAQANNPWLQELPDPISKVAWGNYAALSPASAKKLGVVEGQVLSLTAAQTTVELPAFIQPGMADGVVAMALGYGRKDAGLIAANYPTQKMFPIEKELLGGADVFPFRAVSSVAVQVTGKKEQLAKTQIFDYQTVPFTGDHREQIRETTLSEYQENPRAGNETHHESHSLWPGHEYPGHHWAMAIDLNRCTGCSACIVGCQAENNIPVVGKTEMRKSRDMHWIRLDRYYSGSVDSPEDNPDVSFQPMLCQQCDNAPCETVCPVLATTHSDEGLNMQVYNRCVGTKYCANNCPYKVRRFNWFDYAHEDLLQNLVLNPDVTVRTRGVMEKCTFCVQRINAEKRNAKADGRILADGDIQPACAQSCPAQAIVFGDSNDPQSLVSKLAKTPRSYTVLQELGTAPSVNYLVKVRNRNTQSA